MHYKIKEGDEFLCIKDYVMDSGAIAYRKGFHYKSEMYGCITNNDDDISHDMTNQDDFFEYFEILQKENNSTSQEQVNHPCHYGGDNNPYEAIKVIEALNLDFHLGNTFKYIARAGKKDNLLQDLKKAKWYLDRKIEIEEKLILSK